ncbi:hypothetical protein CVD25_06680 [Bacillus canaveralius]|uniref:Protein-L-IsoD(D-D) O-methyltransferase n=1 Tax=Bacillus canaveralius TaxID=1403243 RepID=A0A2N5GJ29_9BACI|nr:class I SAM-dependent methyltransferase [Bacillus canaveralius]PLR81067.1 hypothetical protein CU635_16275 [Bacillus canaveralius]PLR98959.1 hypothetical protein CVD25_06680 [Bacillus canaveralius]RSK49731.1 hypothetical protein EJA13_15400 [Bacillus canaveralius]
MIITTAGRTNDSMVKIARTTAAVLGASYVERRKRSIAAIQELVKDDCLIIGKDRLELYLYGTAEPFFFHPNSAMFRIKRLMKGGDDPFLDAAGLQKGMSVLDLTLGLASDSIVASFAVGNEGKITGIEGNSYIAYIVNQGLKEWDSGFTEINEAMRGIDVVHANATDYLRQIGDNSYDCVYLDPMFEETILESDGIKSLAKFALYEPVTKEMIDHARRVARHRVVLKDHFRSSRFAEFGFKVQRRKTAKFHFGVMEKEKG